MPAACTFALRHAVLRPHDSIADLALPGDDDAETGTFAAVDEATGEVLSTANVRLEPAPFDVAAVAGQEAAGHAAWRLRGMATRPELRGRGLGAAVLDACVAHVAARGGGLLWCNARVPAVPLYARAGFVTHGDEWVDPTIGPHVVMWRNVEDAPGTDGETVDDA